MNKKYLIYTGLVLVFSLFGIFYFDMIMSLPLFGDATIHGSITKKIMSDNLLTETNLNYPPFYAISQGILFCFFGEKGLNLITLLGVFLIATSIFLLVRELTNSKIAFASTIFVLASPKLVFYSARMYMEILISGFVIFAIFVLFRYLKTKSRSYFSLLIFLVAVTSTIKQQGIFLVFPSIVIFLFYLYKKKKIISKKYIALFIIVFLMIVSSFYIVLIHADGLIFPRADEVPILKDVNNVLQKIAGFEETSQQIIFDDKWEKRLQEINDKFYDIGETRAESRHIWPGSPIMSLESFKKVHDLYLYDFWGSALNKNLDQLIYFLLILGIVTFLLNVSSKDKTLHLKKLKEQKNFVIFLIIFLIINYLSFFINNDQMRYHLFIAILFSLFFGLSIYTIAIINKNPKFFWIILLSFLLILIPLASQDIDYNKRWYKSQLYSPSVGGINSVQEAADWIKNNTAADTLLWQNCGAEIKYYSERDVVEGFEYYFLNQSELEHIFKDRGIEYMIIFDSQIVSDEDWKSFCWMPKSYVTKVEGIYSVVYETSKKDIKIYQIK